MPTLLLKTEAYEIFLPLHDYSSCCNTAVGKNFKDNYADKGVKPVNTFAYIHFTF